MGDVWARWHWKEGRGRWHAVADVVDGRVFPTNETVKAHVLACGRVRADPDETAANPTDDKVCPTCKTLDGLRAGYKPETADVPEAVLVGVLRVPKDDTR